MKGHLALLSVFCLILTASYSTATAQKLAWGLDAAIFVDNGEGSSRVIQPRTLGGAWIAPRIGLSIDDSTNRSTHRFMVGVDFTQQFGMAAFGEVPKVQLFYNYQGVKGANHSLGLLPRSALTGHYSRAIFNDSLRYFSHTIQGAVLSWRGAHVAGEVFFDWFALDRASRQEAFMVGGAISAQFLQVGRAQANLYYAHNKLSSDRVFIRDIAAYNVMLGVDVARFLPLDVLSLDLGVLGSLDRQRISIRNAGSWEPAIGLNARFKVGYKGFLIDDEFFVGQGLSVLWGSEYYREPLYNRAEISWSYQLILLKKCAVDFKASLVLHTTPRGSDFSQMATVNIKI